MVASLVVFMVDHVGVAGGVLEGKETVMAAGLVVMVGWSWISSDGDDISRSSSSNGGNDGLG